MNHNKFFLFIAFFLLCAPIVLSDIIGSGGTETTFTNSTATYVVHTFTSNGTFTVTGSGTVKVLVIAGGGGGGGTLAGNGGAAGGGAGGLRYVDVNVSTGSYTIAVGQGGAGGASATQGTNGGQSSFGFVINATGGGGGSRASGGGANGNAGGSGGGAYYAATPGAGNLGAYTPTEGYSGSQGCNGAAPYYGGGGGGSATAAVNSSCAGGTPGSGGNGTLLSINGSAVYYAGGGGGGNDGSSSSSGIAGLGGGGTGGKQTAQPTAGTANTGGGGGGGAGNNGGNSSNYAGASGGTGVVIIQYVEPAGVVLEATLKNAVNDTMWPNSVTFGNVTGNLTFNYFNITGSGYCVTYTGNGTGTNCTAGNGASTYFNVTNTTLFSIGGTVTASTYQAKIQLSAYRLWPSQTISTFNATNNRAFNSTTTGAVLLYALNGSNNIAVGVAGNYSRNATCTVSAPLQTISCNATAIHDNWYSFNATDIWNNVAVTNFTLVISNGSLGGVLYNQSTTNGSLNVSLLQGYTYFIQFTTPNGTYEYVNVSLPANSTYHRYEFEVLPAPSIDITIRDAETNALILENVTVQLINNITGQTNYTIDGGFFSGEITIGTYTIKLESANYSQSVYTVTVNAGSVYFLTAYLQFAPETVVMQFVDSISSSVVLPDTAVSQERIVNGSWQVISSKVTDITGRTSFRYADDTAYRFNAIKTGYDSKLFTLDPILFSSYTINMVRDTALDFDEDFQSVYVGYSPYIYYNDQQNQMNITFSSPLGTFTSYEYTVKYPGGIKNGSGTNVVGQTYTIDFNITGASLTDRVNITLTYDTSIGPQRSYNYSNGIISSPGNTTFIANQGNTYGLGLLERLIIGTLIIIIVAGLITVGAGPLWGAGMGLFIMGIWLKIGFWPWWAAGLSLLVGFALLSGRTD